MNRRRILTFVAWIAAALVLTVGASIQTISSLMVQQRTSLTVSAAISSSNALQEIKTIYQRSKPNVNITYNFGASAPCSNRLNRERRLMYFSLLLLNKWMLCSKKTF